MNWRRKHSKEKQCQCSYGLRPFFDNRFTSPTHYKYYYMSNSTYQLSSSSTTSSTSRSSTKSKADSSSLGSLSHWSFWQLKLYNGLSKVDLQPDFKWSSLILASIANERPQLWTLGGSASAEMLQEWSEFLSNFAELLFSSLWKRRWLALMSNSSGSWLQ